jgi:hypothetical protein
MGNSARLQRDSLIRFDNGRLLMAREPESFERVLDWTEGEMNELEPDAQQQWLWFGAVLLAMTIIAFIATSLPR